jgi:hypothetical protein
MTAGLERMREKLPDSASARDRERGSYVAMGAYRLVRIASEMRYEVTTYTRPLWTVATGDCWMVVRRVVMRARMSALLVSLA